MKYNKNKKNIMARSNALSHAKFLKLMSMYPIRKIWKM